LIINVCFGIIYVKHGLDVINLQIKLYSKLDPRRLKEPVRDFSGIQKLLESTGEPVVIESFSKQIFDKTLVIRRDVTFIGNFVCQLFLTGDASVTILNGNISSPNEDVYPIILDRNYVGQLSIINSKITLSSKANQKVALLSQGFDCEQLVVENSYIEGALISVRNLMFIGDVEFDSPIETTIKCHIFETDNCDLKLKQTNFNHDVDLVDLNSLTINGKCILSGGFDIGHLIIDNKLKTLETLILTNHFEELAIVRLGDVTYEHGLLNKTHIYLNHTKTLLLGDISSSINWRIKDSILQVDNINDDNCTWGIDDNVSIQISSGANSKLLEYDGVQIIDTTDVSDNQMQYQDVSVFEHPEFVLNNDLDVKPSTATDRLNEMIGQPLVKQQLSNFVAQAQMDKIRVARGLSQGNSSTKHMVFVGPPGVGKTEFARLVGQALYENGVLPENKFVEVSAARDLIAGYKGQTAEQTHKVAESAYGGVLFIDEAYALLDDSSENDFGTKAVQQLLKEAEDHRDELVIILAGYEDDMLELFEKGNAGLKRRFPYWITFENYTYKEFVDIFKLMLKDSNSVMSNELITSKAFKELIIAFAGSDENAGGVRSLLERLLIARDSRLRGDVSNLSDSDLVTITAKDLITVYNQKVADLRSGGVKSVSI
jgi:hypothetical protein